MNKNSPEATRDKLASVSTLLALIWIFGFTLWFHSFELPNNKDRVDRSWLWTTIPLNMLEVLIPSDGRPGDAPFSVFYLFQRVPFLLIAALIWSGAWGLGASVLRFLRLSMRGGEHFFFSTCLGLSAVSLTMLLFGRCGWMSRWPMICFLAFFAVTGVIRRPRRDDRSPREMRTSKVRKSQWPEVSRLTWIVLIVCVPFVAGELIGAMSPQTDFDVVEYHLGGPKEWFLQGRIARLPHNVYTSFPFLSEMLILSGMVIYGDWQWGALAGQAVIAGFGPLTAIGLVAAGQRFYSSGAGWVAALVYLSSPWTYRIAIIAYAEGGLACFLFAALYAALIYRQQIITGGEQDQSKSWGIAVLAGLFSGSALACKYTGLVSVVIPVGLILVGTSLWYAKNERIRRTVFVGLLFSAGVLSTVGPWLAKNAIETGNPVYPLAVRIFGGTDRDPEIDAKWRRGHANTYKNWQDRLKDLPAKLRDVVATNDWHSPLMFALAPLSLLVCLRRREGVNGNQTTRTFQPDTLGVVWLYVGWQFVTWWLLTHHIDRFYVPMFSAVALLAGVGCRWWERMPSVGSNDRGRAIWNVCAVCLVSVTVLYNANVMLMLGGFNSGRYDLVDARDRIVVAPRVRWINDAYESGQLPRDTKVLCVGEALLFHARYPYLYNTVFDHSLFEQICKVPGSPDGQMRPAEEIRTEFRRRGITYVDVNWSEILRYREPGNYGYTDFVHPDRFAELQRSGVLGPQCLPVELSLAPLSDELRERLEQWAPSLITSYRDQPSYIAAQMFQVMDNNRATAPSSK